MENDFIDTNLTDDSIAELRAYVPGDEEIHIAIAHLVGNVVSVITDRAFYKIEANLEAVDWLSAEVKIKSLKTTLLNIPLGKVNGGRLEKTIIDSVLVLETESTEYSLEFGPIESEIIIQRFEDILYSTCGNRIKIKVISKGLLKAFGIGKEIVKESIKRAGDSIDQSLKEQKKIDEAKQTITSKSEVYEEAKSLLVNKYETIREIGRGGMGIVYEAVNKNIGKTVALKKMKEELALNPRDRNKFIEEARRVAQLHHDNIVDVYDILEEGKDIYLVFEFVKGQTIEQVLNSSAKFEVKKAVKIIEQVCEALKYAHEKRIIHRDIKLSNMILDDSGRVKVMDFGIAREAKDSLTRLTGKDTSGTLAYMAPEQELGSYSEQSDIFSLGVCLYEMLTGDLPFKGPNFYLQKEKMIYRKISEMIPEIPGQIDDIINKCLQSEKGERYDSVGQMLDELLPIGGQ